MTPLLNAETTEAVIAGVPATVVVPGLVTLILGIITSVVAWVNRKGGARDIARQEQAKADAERERDERARREPGWDDIVKQSADLLKANGDMWKELQTIRGTLGALQTSMTRRDRATANVLRSAADQWPKNSRGPVFDPEDLAVLEDTVPHQWRIAPVPEGPPS